MLLKDILTNKEVTQAKKVNFQKILIIQTLYTELKRVNNTVILNWILILDRLNYQS